MRARLIVVLALVAFGLAPLTAGAAGPLARWQPPKPAAPAAGTGPTGEAFIQLSIAANTGGDTSFLYDPGLDNQPAAKLFVMNVLAPYGTAVSANDKATGVWYADPNWGIYNDDGSNMDVPRAWNVFVPPPDDTVFVHTTSVTSTAVAFDSSVIDDPRLNNHPEAILFLQHVFNPPGSASNYFTPTVSLVYNNALHKWEFFRQDDNSMPVGATFFVLKAGANDVAFQHITSSANHLHPDATALDNPLINGNPDALIAAEQNFGTGVTNLSVDQRFGVRYDSGNKRWLIVTADGSGMPNGLMFNVLVVPPKVGYFVQKGGHAAGGNTMLDNPDLNGNPSARITVMHDYNPAEAPNLISNDHPIGVVYNAGDQHWYLLNGDSNPITLDANFNVYYTTPRGNSFIVSANESNSTTVRSMAINSPLLNGQPQTIAINTPNQTPNGVAEVEYPSTAGLEYAASAWQIFNTGGQAFTLGLSYNVLVPPATSSFVVTGTTGLSGNILGNELQISSPLTDNDPWALVFASPRDNGGIDENNIGVYFDVHGHWSILNEDSAPMLSGQTFNVFVAKRHPVFLPFVR